MLAKGDTSRESDIMLEEGLELNTGSSPIISLFCKRDLQKKRMFGED